MLVITGGAGAFWAFFINPIITLIINGGKKCNHEVWLRTLLLFPSFDVNEIAVEPGDPYSDVTR